MHMHVRLAARQTPRHSLSHPASNKHKPAVQAFASTHFWPHCIRMGPKHPKVQPELAQTNPVLPQLALKPHTTPHVAITGCNCMPVTCCQAATLQRNRLLYWGGTGSHDPVPPAIHTTCDGVTACTKHLLSRLQGCNCCVNTHPTHTLENPFVSHHACRHLLPSSHLLSLRGTGSHALHPPQDIHHVAVCQHVQSNCC